jgi:dihydrolipoamide dehydrogenase
MVMGELEQEAEVLVIGSGPGGYAAAFRAADLGLDVTMVDTARRPPAPKAWASLSANPASI